VILVDNLDKGWPTGRNARDLMIIRSLLEATRKLKAICRSRVSLHSWLFLRNDIYEHLLTLRQIEEKILQLLSIARSGNIKELVLKRIRTSLNLKGSSMKYATAFYPWLY